MVCQLWAGKALSLELSRPFAGSLEDKNAESNGVPALPLSGEI